MSSPEKCIAAELADFPFQDLSGLRAYKSHAVEVVEHLIQAVLLECCSVALYGELRASSVLEELKPLCAEDLLTFARKDPASGPDVEVIARTSTSYTAVLHYRVAHWIFRNLKSPEASMLAGLVSRRGKLLSGAEIHFRSSIGERFVLDHGYGTVIGETAVIGSDCYILGGVTLGSRQIADNLPGPRHPQLGDRVQVGMHTCVLGPIRIGDDVFIGSRCLVTRDVPAGYRVTQREADTVTCLEKE